MSPPKPLQPLEDSHKSAAGPAGVQQLAAACDKTWIKADLPYDQSYQARVLKVYFMFLGETMVEKRRKNFLDDPDKKIDDDPRPACVLEVLKEWTACTGIVFVRCMELTEKHHIRVAFGCNGPSDEEASCYIRVLENHREKFRLDQYLGLSASNKYHRALEDLYKETYGRLDLGAWSYVGTDALEVSVKEPTMNLGFNIFKFHPKELPKHKYRQWKATILHEFGHALGFEHEGPHGVPYDEAQVLKYYMENQGWDEKKTRHNVLKPYGKLYQGKELDTQSIMWYAVDEELLDKTKPGWEKFVHGENFELSETDKKWARDIYA